MQCLYPDSALLPAPPDSTCSSEGEMREWAEGALALCAEGGGASGGASGWCTAAQVTSVSRVQTMEGETCDKRMVT